MSINIFQFLKQGTTLNRKSLKKNQQLQSQIIPKERIKNSSFEAFGKFNESDSQESQQLKTLNEIQLQHQENKRKQRGIASRKKLSIKVQGLDVPHPILNFTKMMKKFNISKQIGQGIAQLGFKKPTPVQTQVIPSLLQKRNTLVTAPTGTGKTLSFLLPIVSHIEQNCKKSKKIEAVIIAPLQELATQITHELSILVQKTNITYQCISQLSEEQQEKITSNKSPGFNILVTTPLSFLYSFQKHPKLLKNVKYVILDECDKYFEESFLEQIQKILELFKDYHPVYGLFSATIQHPVQELLKTELLDDCIRVQVGGKNKVLEKINQSLQYCTNEIGKLVQLKNMITQGKFIPPILIFVQEKQRAKQLYFELKKILKGGMDISKKVQVLTGDKDKQTRQSIIEDFDAGNFWVLITTDLVARGIDFKNVNLVVNYDFPNSILTYIHRVGRTGRAERKGTAVTLFTDQDKPLVRSLGNLLKVSGCEVPEWMCQIPKAHKKLRKKLQKYPVKRIPIGMVGQKDENWNKQIQRIDKKWHQDRQKYMEKKKVNNDDDDGWIQVHGDQDQPM